MSALQSPALPLGMSILPNSRRRHTHSRLAYRRWEAKPGSKVTFAVPDNWSAGRIWVSTSNTIETLMLICILFCDTGQAWLRFLKEPRPSLLCHWWLQWWTALRPPLRDGTNCSNIFMFILISDGEPSGCSSSDGRGIYTRWIQRRR